MGFYIRYKYSSWIFYMSRFIQDINGFLVLTSIFIAYKGNSYALPVWKKVLGS